MTRTLTQKQWDYLTHTDDYLEGRISAAELERYITCFLAAYDTAGQTLPTVVRTPRARETR